MNKIVALSLLACLLLNMRLAFAGESEYYDSVSYDSNVAQEPTNSQEFTVLGSPLSERKFFITLISAKDLIKSGLSAISAIGWFFGGIASTQKRIFGLLHMSPPKVADVLLKLKVIEVKLNQNYENAVDFKNSVTKRKPEAESSILISRRGFYCDKKFCKQAGEEQYGMGICTPYYCDCNREDPKAKRCKNLSEAFDPVYKNCAEAYKVKICGF